MICRLFYSLHSAAQYVQDACSAVYHVFSFAPCFMI